MTTLGNIIFIITLLVLSFLLNLGFLDDIKNERWIRGIFGTLGGCIAAFLFDMVIFLCLAIISYGAIEDNSESATRTPIYSIGVSTGNEINGQFVLGCGGINGYSYPTYRFFTFENNKYRLCEVNANNFDVVCTDDVEPQIVIDATKTVEKIVRLKSIFDENKLIIERDKNKEDYTGTIYIPKNSIIQTYKIQL